MGYQDNCMVAPNASSEAALAAARSASCMDREAGWVSAVRSTDHLQPSAPRDKLAGRRRTSGDGAWYTRNGLAVPQVKQYAIKPPGVKLCTIRIPTARLQSPCPTGPTHRQID